MSGEQWLTATKVHAASAAFGAAIAVASAVAYSRWAVHTVSHTRTEPEPEPARAAETSAGISPRRLQEKTTRSRPR